MLCLRASPESQDASIWIQDINTAKFLLESSFTNYALAHPCLDVINQLLPHDTASEWSPTQLNLAFTEPGFKSWFEWPDMGGNMPQPTYDLQVENMSLEPQ
jgi:hypothetical protein